MIEANAWSGVFNNVSNGRVPKPRQVGISMVIDKNLGTRALADLLETAGDAIDQIKLAFGTSAAMREPVVRAKIEMIRAAGIDV